jgi:Tol biopolymer transport system component
MAKITIEEIKDQHQALSERLAEEQDPQKLLKDVSVFIVQVRAAGESAPPGHERELLRSLADAWGNFVFRESGVFPPTELDPYTGPEPQPIEDAQVFWYQQPITLILMAATLVTLVVVIVVMAFSARSAAVKATQTADVAYLVSQGQTAAAVTFAWQTETAPKTNTPTVTPTLIYDTPTPVVTTPDQRTATIEALLTQAAILDLTPTPYSPTNTPTPIPGTPGASGTGDNLPIEQGLAVQIANLVEGQEVGPKMLLQGTYSNLSPGWSIHLLLQSLSEGGTIRLLDGSWTVPEDNTSGEWELEVTFGQGEELTKRVSYNIIPVVVWNNTGLMALNRLAYQEVTEVPKEEGLFSAPQIVADVPTVVRGVYVWIDDVRLVYSALIKNKSVLFTTGVDGSDHQIILVTENTWRLQPDVSPSGKQIVFVDKEVTLERKELYRLWLVNSNGSNPRSLTHQSNPIEQPVWSPDGRFIAYSTVLQSFVQAKEPGEGVWSLFLYDVENATHHQLTKGINSARYPSWMPKGESLVFSSISPETNTMAIFLLDIETGEVNLVLDMPKFEENHPAVSPDGRQIAFSATTSPEVNADIYLFDIAAEEITRLTGLQGDDGLDWYPAWHPDGKMIFFESLRVNGTPTIWALDLADNSLVQVTSGISDKNPYVGLLKAFWLLEE